MIVSYHFRDFVRLLFDDHIISERYTVRDLSYLLQFQTLQAWSHMGMETPPKNSGTKKGMTMKFLPDVDIYDK